VKRIGVLVALLLVAVCAYVVGAKPYCPKCECPDDVVVDDDAPRSDQLLGDAALLASILVGRLESEGPLPAANNYHELCLALAGGMGGEGRCEELRKDTEEAVDPADEGSSGGSG
jgi:hypothetical protein